MDQRPDDLLSKTEVTENREANEQRLTWARPAELTAATPVSEEAAGVPAPPQHVADALPSAAHPAGNGLVDGAAEPQERLEENVETHDHESAALDRLRAETPAEVPVELMAVDSLTEYRARWGAIQTGFVDDPSQAVRDADHLVADVMQHLATTFAEERGRLEERGSAGNEDTEHLRLALRRYRQLFALLLKE